MGQHWPSVKARKLLAALLRIGWRVERIEGSHRILTREGYYCYVFAFHDADEIPGFLVKKVANATGLELEDL